MASTASAASTKKTSTALKAPGKGSVITKAPKTAAKTTTTLRETTVIKEPKPKPEKPTILAPPTHPLKEPPAGKPTLKPAASRTTASVSPEERQRMIRDAAYYRAERRGFMGGDPHQDWVDAEYEIDQMLMKRG